MREQNICSEKFLKKPYYLSLEWQVLKTIKQSFSVYRALQAGQFHASII